MPNNKKDMHILGNVKGGTWGKKSLLEIFPNEEP